eukprot:GHUV01019711.1.p3 GENE.GHUV01019711.1~~GHUV01019711.1.p3  ORF type:complete len:102 (+),score=32.87 GHUV01019711.1:590-895(+)
MLLAAELSQKVSQAEAAAVYSDAKALHEQNVAEINKAIADVQQDVQRVHSSISGKLVRHWVNRSLLWFPDSCGIAPYRRRPEALVSQQPAQQLQIVCVCVC